MKKLFYLFVLITSNAFATDVVNVFEEGNAFYRQEKYQAAADSYESLVRSGMQSSELYFNLGNAYYKLNKVAPAIYNFEKALLLDPNDGDIQNNLKFAHKMMIDEVKGTSEVGFKKSIHNFTSTFDYNSWAWIAVGLAVSFLLFFCGYYFSAAAIYKRMFFIGMFFLAILLLLCVLSAIFEKKRLANERPAIVFAGIAPIKSEPKATAGEAVVLHEGTKVYVIETLDEWKHIKLQDGSDGWILSSNIKELK